MACTRHAQEHVVVCLQYFCYRYVRHHELPMGRAYAAPSNSLSPRLPPYLDVVSHSPLLQGTVEVGEIYTAPLARVRCRAVYAHDALWAMLSFCLAGPSVAASKVCCFLCIPFYHTKKHCCGARTCCNMVKLQICYFSSLVAAHHSPPSKISGYATASDALA